MIKSMKRRGGVLTAVALALALVLALVVTYGAGSITASAAAYEERYSSDYGSKMEAIEAGAELNERIAEEGMVLLKNNGVLPLKAGGKGTDAAKVSLFGYMSVKPEGGSNGNDTQDNSVGVTKIATDVYSSMAKAGFKTNPVIKAVYTDWMSKDAKNVSDYAGGQALLDSVKSAEYSFAQYGDAAVVVLGATRAPTIDDGRTMKDADAAAFDDPATADVKEGHSRQIDKYQKGLLDYVCDKFDNVIVVINDSIAMELGYIQNKTAVDAVILAGNPGVSGFDALGKIISGKINPSGKTADIYPADFTKDPTYHNIGHNFLEPVGQGTGGVMGFGKTDVAGGNQFVDENGKPLNAWFSQYEEGIYVGYRYYETAAAEAAKNNYTGFDYDNAVVYPFGYGMSYTSFEWEFEAGTATSGTIASVNDKIELNVKVTNTGTVAGKDVVQLYYTAPYTPDGIEKSHVVLADFAKTKLLAPNKSDTVKLTVMASDMASYDYKTDKTYVLDAGDYELKVMKNSHEVAQNSSGQPLKATYNLASKLKADKSDQTGETITNAFGDVSDTLKVSANAMAEERMTVLSRANFAGNWPAEPKMFYVNKDGTAGAKSVAKADAENILTAEQFATWDVKVDAAYDNENAPWYVAAADMPKFVKEADAAARPADDKDKITLDEMIGKSADDPMWEKLLDQLTIKEMAGLINNGGFGSVSIPYINKPQTHDTDGPAGWSGSGTGGSSMTKFATAPTIACTWNKELAYEMGKMVGDQGLWGRSDTGESVAPYTGWYGPAMNTHRSPFLSRYSEYYSEDGYLAGIMAANAVIGAREKGCYATIKHFAPHEDGATDRGIMAMPGADEATKASSRTSGLSIIANEQTLREIYFKPFQIAVEQGAPHGAMSSFSRIGNTWAGGSYGLLTQILRNEWGFEGLVVTDIEIYQFLNADQMIRAGGDLVLSAFHAPNCQVSDSEEGITATQLTAMRNASKNILFSVANSNAMQVPNGSKVVYAGQALDDGKVAGAYTANVATAELNTKFAYSPVTYSITAGALPFGLDMDSETGEISGTPTREGVYTFTVAAYADGYTPSFAQFTIAVDPEKSTSEIVGGSTDKIDGELDTVVGGINASLDKTNEKIAGVNTIVIVALIISAVGMAAAIGAAVLVILGKKKTN